MVLISDISSAATFVVNIPVEGIPKIFKNVTKWRSHQFLKMPIWSQKLPLYLPKNSTFSIQWLPMKKIRKLFISPICKSFRTYPLKKEAQFFFKCLSKFSKNSSSCLRIVIVKQFCKSFITYPLKEETEFFLNACKNSSKISVPFWGFLE